MSGRRQGRAPTKTSPARIRATQRAAQAIDLRLAGKTLSEIAKSIGYRSPQAAHDAIIRGLRMVLTEGVETLRRLEVERLDALWRPAFAAATQGDLAAIAQCLKIMQRRAALLGLDTPVKSETRLDATVAAAGVLVVPGMIDEATWTIAAERQQRELIELEAAVMRRISEPRG